MGSHSSVSDGACLSVTSKEQCKLSICFQETSSMNLPPVQRSTSPKNSMQDFDFVISRICRANSLLAKGQPDQALEGYTEVLSDFKCGIGHPCALLNRSLCYLVLDYPELAASDAYRAVLGAEWAISGGRDHLQYQQVVAYTTFLKNYLDESPRISRMKWMFRPECYVGREECRALMQPLASIMVGERAWENEFVVEERNGKTITVARPKGTPLEDILLKAYYRLILALTKCGVGALVTALEYIDYLRREIDLTSDDEPQFLQLGNQIESYMETEFDWEHQKVQKAFRSGDRDYAATSRLFFEGEGFGAALRTQFTKIPRDLYPWDTYSLNNDNIKRELPLLNRYIRDWTPSCAVNAMLSNCEAPRLVLAAGEDIETPDPILMEPITMAVTTLSQNIVNSETFYYCDNCGVELEVSPAAFESACQSAYISSKLRQHNSCKSPRPDNEANSQDFRTARENAPAPQDRRERRYPSPPTSDEANSIRERRDDRSTIDEDRGFQICSNCTNTTFCSDRCSLTGQGGLAIVPHCAMDQYTESVLPHRYFGLPSAESQLLLRKLFVKSLNHMPEDCSILSVTWIKLLDGKLGNAWPLNNTIAEDFNCNIPDYITLLGRATFLGKMPQLNGEEITDEQFCLISLNNSSRNIYRQSPSTQRIAWSFDQNVRFPIHCLYESGDEALALDTKRFDGWMINTLLAKLESGMRVTEQPRLRRTIGDTGQTIYFSLPSKAEGNVVYGDPDTIEDQKMSCNPFWRSPGSIWVASINPITNLITDAPSNMSPNVVITEKDDYCITCPLQTRRPCNCGECLPESPCERMEIEPYIRKGQAFLRYPVMLREIPKPPALPQEGGDFEEAEVNLSESLSATMLEVDEVDFSGDIYLSDA